MQKYGVNEDAYDMPAEKLPSAYMEKYKDPELFNQEYHKYVSHINASVDESGEGGDSNFTTSAKLDFYSRGKGDRSDDEEDSGDLSAIQLRPQEPSLGSQPSIQGIENAEEIGGNVEVTGASHVSMEDMTEKIDMASAADFDTFKANMVEKFGEESFEEGYAIIKSK